MIREIEKKDYRHITKIHRDCFPHDNWGVRVIADIISHHGCFGILLEEDKEIVSFIICRALVLEGEILSFGVSPKAQGKGYGKKILKTGIEELIRRNARAIYIEVADENEYAKNFYLSNGFKITGMRPKYYERKDGRIDAILMKYKVYN